MRIVIYDCDDLTFKIIKFLLLNRYKFDNIFLFSSRFNMKALNWLQKVHNSFSGIQTSFGSKLWHINMIIFYYKLKRKIKVECFKIKNKIGLDEDEEKQLLI